MKKKYHVAIDTKVRLEEILARVQTRTRKEKKPKVRLHIMMYAFGSRMLQVATPVTGGGTRVVQGWEYQIFTINLGPTTHEQKIDEF